MVEAVVQQQQGVLERRIVGDGEALTVDELLEAPLGHLVVDEQLGDVVAVEGIVGLAAAEHVDDGELEAQLHQQRETAGGLAGARESDDAHPLGADEDAGVQGLDADAGGRRGPQRRGAGHHGGWLLLGVGGAACASPLGAMRQLLDGRGATNRRRHGVGGDRVVHRRRRVEEELLPPQKK